MMHWQQSAHSGQCIAVARAVKLWILEWYVCCASVTSREEMEGSGRRRNSCALLLLQLVACCCCLLTLRRLGKHWHSVYKACLLLVRQMSASWTEWSQALFQCKESLSTSKCIVSLSGEEDSPSAVISGSSGRVEERCPKCVPLGGHFVLRRWRHPVGHRWASALMGRYRNSDIRIPRRLSASAAHNATISRRSREKSCYCSCAHCSVSPVSFVPVQFTEASTREVSLEASQSRLTVPTTSISIVPSEFARRLLSRSAIFWPIKDGTLSTCSLLLRYLVAHHDHSRRGWEPGKWHRGKERLKLSHHDQWYFGELCKCRCNQHLQQLHKQHRQQQC